MANWRDGLSAKKFEAEWIHFFSDVLKAVAVVSFSLMWSGSERIGCRLTTIRTAYHLFSSIVLPSITYGLPVYGASEAELTAMQCFLDRCYKRKYTSKSFSIKHLLEKQDRKVFRKVSGIDRHPLRGLLPKKKVSTYNLRNRTSQYPKVNTDRFKNSYINRLIFNYDLAMWVYFFLL